MENSYGIGVRNRYELFYDEEIDPLEYLKKTGSKKREKKDKISEKENKAKTINTKDSLPGKKIVTTNNEIETKPSLEKTSQSESKQQQPRPRNNERIKFSDREERNNRRNKPEADNKESKDRENREKDRDNREKDRDNRDNRESKDNKDSKENRENGAPQRFDGETRGRGGRGGGFRGGRGLRRGGRSGGPGNSSGAGEFRSKREYDRQSGMVTSGVKPVDKREGSGPYNWGSDKDQIGFDEQVQDDQATDLDTSGENTEKPTGDQDGSAPPPTNGEVNEAPKEEEQREMTLDEWKALQKREKPVFRTRRPGEGDTGQWKKTYILKKKIKETTSGESDEEEDVVQHGRKKVLLPIDFQFADTPTRGRGRGRGRGGPGRGRGMGGGRGRGAGGRYQGNSRQEAPKMDDERDFPSLG